MTTSRREFLATAAATGLAAAAWTPASLAHAVRPRPRKKLRLLILGGTGFLGPAMVELAHAAGHELTLFNRGKREKTKGTSYDFVTKVYGNRDPKKNADEADPKSPMGLTGLEEAIKNGATWDAVLDNSGYFPRHVAASAELLRGACERYLFISSVSAYAANDVPDADESAPLATLSDPTVEAFGADFSNYGGLKALCEQAAEKAMPGRSISLRAGYIVGPRDDTDRFTYWPVRSAAGGEMLVPGEPTDPVQFIDVRDLAAFALRCVETGQAGAFTVTSRPVAWGVVMKACADAAGAKAAEQVWIPNSFLGPRGAGAGQLPIWIPAEGEFAGFHKRGIAKALAAGLTCRPPLETVRTILDWWPGEVERRTRVTAEMKAAAKAEGKPEPQMPDQALLRAGPTREREAELIKEWKASQK